MSEEKNNKENIEVVTGDGDNLDISPVYDNLINEKPKSTKEKPKNIVIPKEKKKDN